MSLYRLTRAERIFILCAGLVMLAVGLWLSREVKALLVVALAFVAPIILLRTLHSPKPPQR